MTPNHLDHIVRTLDPIDGARLRQTWDAAPVRVALRDDVARLSDGRDSRRPRRRRITVAIAALTLIAATGWTSYRLLGSDPTAGFGCRQPNGLVAVIDLQSGDHAADCAAYWRLRGVNPPSLVAYERPTSDGTVVEVVPASEPVPDSWTPVNLVGQNDRKLLELESQMDDYVDGLRANCRDGAAAAMFVRNELRRLRLTSWRVVVLPRGQHTCATATVDVRRSTVSVRPADDGQPTAEAFSWMAFAVALRDAVADRCLDVTTADEVAHRLADRIDAQRSTASYADAPLSEGLLITTVTDDARTCTEVDLNVYGVANLKLRGPTAVLE